MLLLWSYYLLLASFISPSMQWSTYIGISPSILALDSTKGDFEALLNLCFVTESGSFGKKWDREWFHTHFSTKEVQMGHIGKFINAT